MRKSSVSFSISNVKWGEKMSMFNLLVSGCPLLFRLNKKPVVSDKPFVKYLNNKTNRAHCSVGKSVDTGTVSC